MLACLASKLGAIRLCRHPHGGDLCVAIGTVALLFSPRLDGATFAILLFFASPRFTGVLAFCGMNIASTLYLLAFVAGVPGIRKNRWGWFYLAVFLAAIIKITFLALLLLPVLAGRRQWWRSALCGVAVIAANLGERSLWPSFYAGYQWALRQGILVQQSYGYGIFGVLASYHHTQEPRVGPGPYVALHLVLGWPGGGHAGAS